VPHCCKVSDNMFEKLVFVWYKLKYTVSIQHGTSNNDINLQGVYGV